MTRVFIGNKKIASWITLTIATAIVTVSMNAAGVPAAFMIGAMLSSIFFVSYVCELRLDRRYANFSQAVVGVFIGGSLHPEMISGAEVPIYISLSIVILVLLLSLVTGMLVMRSRLLPGSTGLWGALPGAAPMMIIMSEQHGADPSLVAFIQYTRVVLVALIASSVMGGTEAVMYTSTSAHDITGLVISLLIIATSMGFASLISSPAANFLTPIALASIANLLEIPVHTPSYILVIGFVILGWSVGLRFSSEVRYAARKSFARVIFMLLVMITGCYLVGHLLVVLFDVDPFTAYLATSPGGVDSIAIIAAGTSVDISFVVTVQMIRFIILLVWGPAIVRLAYRIYTRISRDSPIEK